MTKKNNLGAFNSLRDVYAKYPQGGKDGDCLTIEGHEYYWDDHNRCWVVPGTSPETALDNLTVNRNLTVGGKAAIKTIKSLDGTVTVEDPMRLPKGVVGDLIVEGSLKARHVRQPNCGLFASVEQLKNIYPNPEVGMWATIGNTIPGDIWRCQVSGHWEPTGEKGGAEIINLENYEHALFIVLPKTNIIETEHLEAIKAWVKKHPDNSGAIFVRPVIAKRTYVVQMYDSTSTPDSLNMTLLSYLSYDSISDTNHDKVYYNESSLNLTTGVWTTSRQEQYRLARYDALESEVTRAKSEEEKLSKRIDNTYTKNETYSKSETYTKEEVNKKLSTIYKPKGSVQNANALLALTGVDVGDTYNVIEAGTMDGEPFVAGMNFVAIKAGLGNQPKMWDPLGGTINTDELAKKDEVAKTYATKQELQEVNNEAVTFSKKFKNMDSLFVLSIPGNKKLSQDVFNRLKSWAETNADQANQYEQRKINAPIIILTVDPVTKDHRSAISSVLSMIDGQNFLQLVGPTLNADEEVATMFNIKISVNLSDAEAPVTVQQTRDFTLAAVNLVTQETNRAQQAEKDLQTHATTLEKSVENIKSKQTEDGKKLDNLDKEMGTAQGDITELNKQTASKLSYVELQVGNSAEIKQANLAALKAQNGQFFVKINYAFGVGTFNASNGGFISTTNAYDNDIYYTIAADGSIAKKDDYIAPNEPYSVHLTQDKIGIQLTEIEGSKVSKAGELVVVGSTGMITYTRTSDSTASVVYFTDDNKDGSTTLLTYNSSNRTIQSTRISKEPEGGYLRPLFEKIGAVYNPDTKRYTYNTIEDMTDSDMAATFAEGRVFGADINNVFTQSSIRTNMPFNGTSNPNINSFDGAFNGVRTLEVAFLGTKTDSLMFLLSSGQLCSNCPNLRKIIGHIRPKKNITINNSPNLTYVRLRIDKQNADQNVKVSLKGCPKIDYDSFAFVPKYVIGTNYALLTSIEVDVLPHALLTGTATPEQYITTGHTKEEWMQIVSDSTTKGITFTKAL